MTKSNRGINKIRELIGKHITLKEYRKVKQLQREMRPIFQKIRIKEFNRLLKIKYDL